MQFIRIGKQEFAFGLFWQLVDNQRRIREDAQRLNMDAYALVPPPRTSEDTEADEDGADVKGKRKRALFGAARAKKRGGGGRVQVGFCSAKEAKRHKNALSAAAYVALSGENESYFASFQLDKKTYWHLAIHNGGILPEGDTICDRETCETLISEHTEIFGSNATPHEYHAEKEVQEFLAALNPTVKKPWAQLHVLQSRSAIIRRYVVTGVVVMGVIVGAIALAKYYKRQQVTQRHQQQKQREAILRARHKKMMLAQERKKALRADPWKGQLPPGLFADLCESKLSHVPFNVNGWELASWSCTAPEKPGGAVTYATNYAPTGNATFGAFPAGYQLQNNQTLLGPATSIGAPSSAMLDRPLPRRGQAYSLYDLAAPVGWSVKFTKRDPVAQFKKIGDKKVLLPWSKWPFMASGSSWPFLFLREFNEVPTLRIISIQATVNTNDSLNWIVSGVLYVQNPNYSGS
ncbi:MAG TPA: type 4b pilus protein PilO2 [Gammaproteobacteria bacterium]|nr:type 4b pilus protein PilO2 [Gammaproteobacteria bacterium]